MLVTDDEVHAPEVRAAWETMLHDNNIDLLFQSPVWFDHLRATDHHAQTVLAVLEQPQGGDIVGIVPLRLAKYSLRYDVGGHLLWRDALNAASILGSLPFLPHDENALSALCAAVQKSYPKCQGFIFNSVPIEHPLWELLHRLKEVSNENRLVSHRIVGVYRHHLIRLPETFADYMARFKGSSRKGFRRQLRTFQDQPGAASALIRVELPEQVDDFLEKAAGVSRKSWQHARLGTRFDSSPAQRSKLRDLAERGVLRAYLLSHGETPCAFSLGYQYRDMFHDFEVGYDQDFAHLSPGTVLFLRMIKDLIQHHSPRFYNFGLGDAPYKANFSSEWHEAASLFLVRDTLGNRLRVALHGVFLWSRGWLERGRAAYKSILLKTSLYSFVQVFLAPVTALQECPIPPF